YESLIPSTIINEFLKSRQRIGGSSGAADLWAAVITYHQPLNFLLCKTHPTLPHQGVNYVERERRKAYVAPCACAPLVAESQAIFGPQNLRGESPSSFATEASTLVISNFRSM
ncbi:jg26359, partial [Pararge aegeria aegeria]